MIKCGQCEYFKKFDLRSGGRATVCTNRIISTPTEDDYCSKGVEIDDESYLPTLWERNRRFIEMCMEEMDEAFENYKKRVKDAQLEENENKEV